MVVFFALLPRSWRANLRHYDFMIRGVESFADGLRKRGVGFVLRRSPGGWFPALFRREVLPAWSSATRIRFARPKDAKARVADALRCRCGLWMPT